MGVVAQGTRELGLLRLWNSVSGELEQWRLEAVGLRSAEGLAPWDLELREL